MSWHRVSVSFGLVTGISVGGWLLYIWAFPAGILTLTVDDSWYYLTVKVFVNGQESALQLLFLVLSLAVYVSGFASSRRRSQRTRCACRLPSGCADRFPRTLLSLVGKSGSWVPLRTAE